MIDDFFEFCSICGFMKPKSYEHCPVCVYGIGNDTKVGRVACRSCGTLVGEHVIIEGGDYYEHVQKCDYCDPPPGATDEDIVSKLHCWVFDPVEPPKKMPMITTRGERRKSIESLAKLAEHLKALEAELKMTDTEEKAIKTLSLSFPKENITRDTRFLEDLGLDSLTFIDVITDLETAFNISIRPEQVEHIQTVGEVIDFLEKETT